MAFVSKAEKLATQEINMVSAIAIIYFVSALVWFLSWLIIHS
jgi:hypothetical protein